MLQDAFELLSARRYKRVEQLLHEQQEDALRSGQMAMVVILAAACQLCLTCKQYRADRKLHQLSLDEATRRERELRLQIRSVLTMLSQLTSLETQAEVIGASDLHSIRPEIARPEDTETAKPPTLLHKVKQLLGFEPTSPPEEARAGSEPLSEARKTSPHDRIESGAPLNLAVQEETSTSPLGDQELLEAVAALLTGPRRQETEDEASSDSDMFTVGIGTGTASPGKEEVSQEPSADLLTLTSPSKTRTEAVFTVMSDEESLLSTEDHLSMEEVGLTAGLDVEADAFPGDLFGHESSAAALVPDQSGGDLLPLVEPMPGEREIDLRDSEQPGLYLLPPPPKVTYLPAGNQPSYLPPVPEVEPPGDTSPEAVPSPSLGIELPLGAPDEPSSVESASLVIYCLGPFRVYQNNELLTEWSGFMGQKILKYIVAQRVKPVSKDVLMDVMWAGVGQEAARRNLHQAIYSLRQTLRRREPNLQHILFENDRYLLNPAIDFWIDFLQFEKYAQDGQRLEAAGETEKAFDLYGIAEGLYQGTFLEEDLYEEWANSQRDHLLNLYLEITDRLSERFRILRNNVAAISLCQKVLRHDPCFEPAHRRLMQCYVAQGQRYLAMRQYQTCVQVMKEELDLNPSAETAAMLQRITS